MVKKLLLIALLGVLFTLCVFSVTAQDESATGARVRFGYFAFQPDQIDTFINGELAPFGAWLAEVGNRQINGIWSQDISTPFMPFPPGTYSFAFAPTGEGVNAALLGPVEVTFEDGHSYSLAIVGQLDDDSLNLLVVDETEVFAGVDRETTTSMLMVHNIAGAPPLNLQIGVSTMAEMMFENLAYAQYAAFSWPSGLTHAEVFSEEDTIFRLPFDFVKGVSGLYGFVGSYPGVAGRDFAWAWSDGFSGEISITDGGAISVGNAVAGEIAEVHSRVRYSLTIEADSTLDARVTGTGRATIPIERRGTRFRPWMFIYDSQGNLSFWNYDINFSSASSNGPINGIDLEAGTYIVEVGGVWDIQAGPYELIIETAESD